MYMDPLHLSLLCSGPASLPEKKGDGVGPCYRDIQTRSLLAVLAYFIHYNSLTFLTIQFDLLLDSCCIPLPHLFLSTIELSIPGTIVGPSVATKIGKVTCIRSLLVSSHDRDEREGLAGSEASTLIRCIDHLSKLAGIAPVST